MRFTVSATVVGFPKASCSCKVIGPNVALDDAAPEAEPVVNWNWEGAPAVMVTVTVPQVVEPFLAVIVGVAAVLSP